MRKAVYIFSMLKYVKIREWKVELGNSGNKILDLLVFELVFAHLIRQFLFDVNPRLFLYI